MIKHSVQSVKTRDSAVIIRSKNTFKDESAQSPNQRSRQIQIAENTAEKRQLSGYEEFRKLRQTHS